MKISEMDITMHMAEEDREMLQSLGFVDCGKTDPYGQELWENFTEFAADFQEITPSLVISSRGRIFLKQPDGIFKDSEGNRYVFTDGLMEPVTETVTKIRIGIFWDTDGTDPETIGLPSELTLSAGEGLSRDACLIIADSVDVDRIIEQLSDEYGYCIEGFVVTVEG